MDSLTVAALLESLLNESRKMREDEVRARNEGNTTLADYISHKHGGFTLAMAFVSEAVKTSQDASLAVLAGYTAEATA